VPATLTATLRQIDAVTPRSRLMTLDLGRRALPFQVGQAVLVGPPGAPRRAYSIASSPEQAVDAGTLDVLVGLGDASEQDYPLVSLAPGAAVDVEGPLGSFLFPPDPVASHLLFIAGGTGIAPLRAMLRHARLAHPDLRASLMYSARRADEFAFLPELEALAASGQLELHRTVTRDGGEWGGQRGRIGRAHFEAVVHDPGHTLCFVCGPPQMVGESVATLTALGVPDAAIRREEWDRK
jgi:NAD(P)H-flavin reductase